MRDTHTCPKCAGNEILFLPQAAGFLSLAQSVHGIYGAYICARCGYTEFYTHEPGKIPVDQIPGAKRLYGKPPAPYR